MPSLSSATAYHKLPALDGLELLAARHYRQPFPRHQHETYNLSLIVGGTEGLEFADATLYAPAGSLSLTHPLEVHANPVLHRPGLSFYTFYVSPAAVAHAAGGQPVRFRERVMHDPALFARFWQLAQAVGQPGPHFDRHFEAALGELVRRHGAPEPAAPPTPADGGAIGALKARLAEQLPAALPLEQLARQHGMDKFKFLRYFKAQTGLTPHNFVLMQRVEAAKRLLQQGAPLVEAALAVGFYDQAHFSRFFKSFVGVSPGQYRALEPPFLAL